MNIEDKETGLVLDPVVPVVSLTSESSPNVDRVVDPGDGLDVFGDLGICSNKRLGQLAHDPCDNK